VRIHTEHLEYCEPSTSLLSRASYYRASGVGLLLTSTPPATTTTTAAARLPGTTTVTSAVTGVVRAGATERRTTYGAGDERVQHADDDHWNDEENDAGRLEDVLQVRHLRPDAAQSRVCDWTSLRVLLVNHAELDPDWHRTAAGDYPDDDDNRLKPQELRFYTAHRHKDRTTRHESVEIQMALRLSRRR